MSGGTSSVGVVASFAVQPDRVEEFIELASREMVAPTLSEPGCLRYELWQDLEDRSRFSMVEEWETEEALQKHLAQPSLQAVVGRLTPMAAAPVTMRRYRPLSVAGGAP